MHTMRTASILLFLCAIALAHPTLDGHGAREPSAQEQRLRSTVATLDEAHEREPERMLLASKRAATLLRLARVTASHTDYQRAHNAFDALVERDPVNTDALVGRGHAAIGLHAFDEALADGREARRLGAETHALALVVDAHIALGHLDEARALAEQLEGDELTLASLARVALVAYERADYETARAYFSDAHEAGGLLDAPPERTAWCLEMLAQVELESGDPRRALALLERADASHRSTDHGAMTTALTLAHLGEIGEAERILAELVDARPSVKHHNAFVRVLHMHGEPHDIELAQHLDTTTRLALEHEISEGDLAHARDLVELWCRTGEQLESAADLALRELADVRRDPKGYEVAAWACHRAGRDAEALLHARRALTLAPERPTALLRCAAAIHHADARLARTLYERAMTHPATLDEREAADVRLLVAPESNR